MILDKINESKDIKSLTQEEMTVLAGEIRELIIKKVNTIGGHMGPNLGIVETTIALHRVFNLPEDKLIYDVSHQCYPHKILTGRKDGFTNADNYFKYTGYTAPEESEYDMFKIGHTSTSVSLATGVAKARDLKGEKYNVIALIGDGSLSGGEALEGFDNAAVLNSNIIIIVNDNEMSIAENHGGLYGNLQILRETKGQSESNFFKTLGFEYLYVEDGNDIQQLISAFEKVKGTNKPTVVHIHTLKGKGLAPAEADKETFHYTMPGVLDTENNSSIQLTEDYNSITKDFIKNKIKTDNRTIVITAGTPGVFGFDKTYRQELGNQYTDVGIAEEHAVAYASALAKNGAKPIFTVMSSFIQRTYDQLSQDLGLNNSPVTILVYWGGISSADATHLCTFDIPLISNIPNLVYMSPTNKEEYLAMLEYAYNQNEYPIAVRVPNTNLISTGIPDTTDYSKINKYKVISEGNRVAVLGLGNFFNLACEVKDELLKYDINSTLINPIFSTGIDEELLENLKQNHELVITIEDGVLDGGFGEKISRFYGNSDIKTLNFGGLKEFTDRIPLDELYNRYHLTKELIVEDILKTIKEKVCR